jgi:hypothetical protein
VAGTPTRTDRLVGPSAPTVETVGMPGVPWHAGHQGADLQTRQTANPARHYDEHDLRVAEHPVRQPDTSVADLAHPAAIHVKSVTFACQRPRTFRAVDTGMFCPADAAWGLGTAPEDAASPTHTPLI